MRTAYFILFLFCANCLGQLPPEMFLISRPSAVVDSSWSPAEISSLVVRYRADDAITDGSGYVTNIPDLKGTYTLTNRIQSTCPTVSNNWLNGHSIVRFDGPNDVLMGTGITTIAQPYTVVYLAHFLMQDDLTGQNFPSLVWPGATYMHGPNGYWWYSYSGTEASLGATNSTMIFKDVVYEFLASGSSTMMKTNWINFGGSNPGTGGINDNLWIGDVKSRATYPSACKVWFAEILIFNEALVATNRSNLSNYFKTTYGLP